MEGLRHLEALGDLAALLAGGLLLHHVAKLDGEGLDVHLLEQLLDGLGAHLGLEAFTELRAVLAVLVLVEDLAFLQGGAAALGDRVGLEVEHALQILQGDVQQVADAAGDALEEPHVADRGGQLDVAHALAAHGLLGDLDAALVAGDAFELLALVLATQAFPVVHGSEDAGAEEAVALGLQAAVVDGLGLGDFALGPGTHLVRAGQGHPDALIGVDVLLLWIHRDLV